MNFLYWLFAFGITGGTTNGAVMTDLVADKQRVEAGLNPQKMIESVTYTAQASGASIGVGFLRKGVRVSSIRLNTSVTLATAQIAVGIVGATGKYRAAAVFTAADAWEDNALNAAVHVVLAADETILITTTVAALPASGTLKIEIEYLES